MSHFSVLAVGSVASLNRQMAPFEESPKTKRYLVFEDTEAKDLKAYQTGSMEEFYCASSSSWGLVVSKQFFTNLEGKKPGEVVEISWKKQDLDSMHYVEEGKYYDVGKISPDRLRPTERIWVKVNRVIYNAGHPTSTVAFEGTAEFEVVNAPKKIRFTKKWATFEIYMKEWHGKEKRDKKHNRFGYWRNPNAKWDYWRIGGRFAGFFQIKPEFRHLYADKMPKLSWEWKDDPEAKAAMERDCKVDTAVKGHVDWEAMRKIAGDEAAERYDAIMEELRDIEPNLPWNAIRKKNKKDSDGGREKYWTQPRCKRWQEIQKEVGEAIKNKKTYRKGLECLSWFSSSPDDFLMSREKYIDEAMDAAVRCFAFLRDGKWAEKGKMGWFACVSNEKKGWEKTFWKLLQDVPDKATLSILDCHI